jgi:hypothetical protein
MEDIERERSKLGNIPGYEPPTDYVYANRKDSMYKTFNSKKKKQVFGSTTTAAKYGSYNNRPSGIENCPTCKERYVCQDCEVADNEECDCDQETYVCRRGHEWYADDNGFIQFGRRKENNFNNDDFSEAVLKRGK